MEIARPEVVAPVALLIAGAIIYAVIKKTNR